MSDVAKALIFDVDDNILVLRRSSTHPTQAFHSDFPGGVVELGETPLVGAMREIEEETQLKIKPGQFKLVLKKRRQNQFNRYLYTAKLDAKKPTVIISWEHDKYEWVAIPELLNRPLNKHADSYYALAVNWLNSNQT